MSAKLVLVEDNGSVRITSMKDGDIGVITHWSVPSYIGLIVQRLGDERLITIGEGDKHGWNYSLISDDSDCKVRILKGNITICIE